MLIPFYALCRIMLKHYKIKFGIDVPFTCSIGPGFRIDHFGTIVLSPNVILGKNCTIHHGVTIGEGKRGKTKGEPILGDNICVCPGAKVIGKINVGDGVVIGVNSVVVKDIPNNSVIAGNPGKIISKKGSEGFIINKIKW